VHRRRIASVLRQTPALAQAWFHDSGVMTAEFSRDGSRVLSACDDGTVRINDLANHKAFACLAE